MLTFIIILGTFLLIYLLREIITSSHSNQLNLIPDKYGAIQVLDNRGLVAILYKDRTIYWIKQVSFIKQVQIKLISDRFEEEYSKLQEKLNNN